MHALRRLVPVGRGIAMDRTRLSLSQIAMMALFIVSIIWAYYLTIEKTHAPK